MPKDSQADRVDLGGKGTGIHGRTGLSLFQINHDACFKDVGDRIGNHNDRLCLVNNDCRAMNTCILFKFIQVVDGCINAARMPIEVGLGGVGRCVGHILHVGLSELNQRALLRSNLGGSSGPHPDVVHKNGSLRGEVEFAAMAETELLQEIR